MLNILLYIYAIEKPLIYAFRLRVKFPALENYLSKNMDWKFLFPQIMRNQKEELLLKVRFISDINLRM